MIYTNPTGGLGNMMFQIAAIHALAVDNNDVLCLLNVKKQINDLNNDIRLNTKHGEKYNYIFNRFHLIDDAPVEWIPNQMFSIPYNNSRFSKVNTEFYYQKLQYHKEHEYVGFFQCEKYFKHIRNEILEIFKPENEFLDKLNTYSHLFNNISLHVRRGDYVNQHAGRMIYLGMEYYNRALSELPNDLLVLVFSDDLNWCKENFIGDRFIFVDELDYIVLYLMSKMKYSIIANSTFSWWGTWLGEMEKVIAPKEWFGVNTSHKKFEYDIIPYNWIKI